MNEWFEDFQSPRWWVSVIVVGLLLQVFGNVITSPIKNWLSRLLFRSSKRAREWKARKEADFREEADRAGNDLAMLTLLTARMGTYATWAFLHFAISAAAFAAAATSMVRGSILSWLLFGLGIAASAIAGGAYGRAARCETIISLIRAKPEKKGEE